MRSGRQPGTLVLSVLQPGGPQALRYRSHREGATPQSIRMDSTSPVPGRRPLRGHPGCGEHEVNPATTDAVGRGLLCLRRGAGKQNKGGAAMVSRLSRLRVLSVLLALVLVAPPLGGRLSARAAAAAASSPSSGTLSDLHGVACPSPSTCVAVGDKGTILRSTDGGRTWRSQPNLFSGTPNNLNGVA